MRSPACGASPGAYALVNVLDVPRLDRERRTTLVMPLRYTNDIGPWERTELAEGVIVRLRPQLGDAYAGVTGVIAAREAQA